MNFLFYKKSTILLIVLLTILFFIIGFRAGQKVEKINKKIDYLLSLTPTKKPTPTPTISFEKIKINRYINNLIYPNNLKINQSSTPGEFIIDFKK